MLQSVDWGAVAFGIVLVELDGKNATKDTGVRHLLAAQGHVYQLVKMPPVPCQHSDPLLPVDNAMPSLNVSVPDMVLPLYHSSMQLIRVKHRRRATLEITDRGTLLSHDQSSLKLSGVTRINTKV